MSSVCIKQRFFTPQKVAKATWNCSVPYWTQFQPHLACNLRSECELLEDEEDCYYRRCHNRGFEVRATHRFSVNQTSQEVEGGGGGGGGGGGERGVEVGC